MKGTWATALGVCAALLGIGLAQPETGVRGWLTLRSDLASAHGRIEALAARNARLEDQVASLAADPFAITRAIRQTNK